MKINIIVKCLGLIMVGAVFTAGARAVEFQNWSGATDSVWDTATLNWSGSAWTNGNAAQFNGGTWNITLNEEIAIAGNTENALVFSNGGQYIFSGSALVSSYAGNNLILRINSATVTFNNFLSYSGGKDFRWTFDPAGVVNFNGGLTTTGGAWELGYGNTNGTINFTGGVYNATNSEVRMNAASINVIGAVTMNLHHMQTRANGSVFTVNHQDAVVNFQQSDANGNRIAYTQNQGALRLVSGTVNYDKGVGVLFVDTAGDRTGLLKVEGGALNIKGEGLVLVNNNDNKSVFTGTGQYIQTGGTVNTTGILFSKLGNTVTGGGATGALTLNGGILYVGSGGIKQTNRSATSLEISFVASGGTIGASSAWTSDVNMTLGGNVTFQAADADDVANNIDLNGVLDGSGGFTKTGGGTLLLSNANSYAGDTIVSGGRLELRNSLALGGVADLWVTSGAKVYLNYGAGEITVDSLWLNNLLVGNLDAGFAYDADTLNDRLSTNIFEGTGKLIIISIPEPSTWILLATGAALLAVLRKRR